MSLPSNVVLLCECHGEISRSLPLEEIRYFLKQKQPRLEVVIGDDFCQSQVLSKLIREDDPNLTVIGACSVLKTRVSSLARNIHFARVLDLLEEAKAPYDKAELAERTKLLLWAQVRRRSASAIPEQALKLEFSRPEGEITRRQFFELALPKYALVPYVDGSKCVGEERCRLCYESCPFDAVEFEKGKAFIDQVACSGCGACVADCPYNAVSYPMFSFEELDREMGALLLANDLLEPRMLAIVCKTCISGSADKFHYPSNVLPLEVPCLAMASPWLILRAFDLGAQGLALMANECRFGLDPGKWEGNISFVQELLDKLGIEPERVKLLGGDELEQELPQFAQEVAELGLTPLRFSEPVERPDDRMWLPALIKGMEAKLGASLTGAVAAGNVPFGKLELNSSRCTGCGLCALDCPTGALSFSPAEEGAYQLLFWQQSCIGCGQCVNSCPEECLRLEKLLELACLSRPAVSLFRDEIARCRECGAPVAPRAMLISLKEKLSGSREDTSYLDLCPGCRIRSRLGLVRR